MGIGLNIESFPTMRKLDATSPLRARSLRRTFKNKTINGTELIASGDIEAKA